MKKIFVITMIIIFVLSFLMFTTSDLKADGCEPNVKCNSNTTPTPFPCGGRLCYFSTSGGYCVRCVYGYSS